VSNYSIHISIVIPTYNGATRLPNTLKAISFQRGLEALNGEVWVIDNNSTDNTAQVVSYYQTLWECPFQLKYCQENRQGLSYARQRGMEVASGRLVGFVDDDNLLHADWVLEAYRFAEMYPKAGVLGSHIDGVFSEPPPPHLKPVLPYLAIVKRGDKPLQYHPRLNGFPPGAGMVVRRKAWLNHVPKKLLLSGRVGKSMLSCEDWEAQAYIYQAGWEIWHNPAMKVQHLIPPERTRFSYLRSNLWGTGLSRHHIRMLLRPWWQRPVMSIGYLFVDACKIVRCMLRFKHRLCSDELAQCEIALLLGTFLSPFYLMRAYWRR
jgi:glycosyltransferase involved in cell wall biosynthesis